MSSAPLLSLFFVVTKGLGSHYVVAQDSHEAYLMLRKLFDAKDYGFVDDRELDSVKLLARQSNILPSKNMFLIKEPQP